MEQSRKLELQKAANRVRQGVIESTYCAKSGHPGGSLSITDALVYLYYQQMRVDPANPSWADRDRLVLSKGHCCPALYSVLPSSRNGRSALYGYLSGPPSLSWPSSFH